MPDNQNFFNHPASAPAEVHTMPAKFISANTGSANNLQTPKKGSKISWIIIAVIILAILGILGGAGYLIYTNLPSKQTQEIVNSGLVNNANQAVNNSNSNKNSNSNSNKNNNSNSNLNQNDNENINDSSNSNDNENSNLNENTNINTNINANVNVKKAADSDIDGLSAAEEIIFGTKVDKPDTDEDGYKDGAEVISGYNPMGSGTLAASELVGSYSNSDYNYSIIYPKNWIVEPTAEDNKDIIFTPNDMASAGEFIEISVDTNPYGFSALDWYLDQNPSVTESQVKAIEVKGLSGVLSVDGYTAYFTDDNYVYVVHYSYGNKTEVNFSTIFQMMYKNFELVPAAATNTNANANTNTSTVKTNKNSNTNTNSDSNTNG